MTLTTRAPGRVPAVVLALLAAPMALGMAAPPLVLPQAAGALGLTLGVVTWVVTTFGWAIAVGTPLLAGVQNRYGERAGLLVAGGLVLGGGLVTVTAPGLGSLLAGGALQGLGSAGFTTIAMSLAGSPRALGLVTASLATVGATAPLAGELIAGLLGWRAALALPVLSLAVLPLALRRTPATSPSRPPSPGVQGYGGRFDPGGAVALTGLVTALVFVPHAWHLAGGAAVLAALLLALRLRTRPDGFVPVTVIRVPRFLAASGLAFGLGVVNFGLLYALPGPLAAGTGWSGTAVGLAMTWPLLFGGLASYGVVAWTERLPFALSAALLAGLAATATVVALLGTAPPALLVAQGLASVAAASGQGVLAGRARTAVPEKDRPAAMGLFNLAYLLGTAFGPALVAG
ncbi:MFS transporter [Nonomuraea sp. NPDC050328]|uniref:MFS transporter n=1 Tax=Nonomuraea sp. NPDC050328 TaxID=3364361 RepID=UPI0037A74C1F